MQICLENTYNAVTKGEQFDENDLISISGDLTGLGNLVKELSTPRRKFKNDNKVHVESKDELAKRDIEFAKRRRCVYYGLL